MNVDNLFDYIKFFFNNHSEYHTLNSSHKAKHHFMLNRFMSIKYPIVANKLNKIGINGASVADSWHLVARQYKKIPNWVYTKTNKSDKNKPNPKLDTNLLKEYANLNKLSSLDIANLEAFYYDDLKKELKTLEIQINTSKK